MPTVIELRQQAKAKKAEAQALLDAADAENRDLTEDESKNFDGLLAEAKTAESQADRRDQLATIKADDNTPLPRLTKTAPESPQVEVKEPAYLSDPNWGFKSPQEMLLGVMKNSDGRAIEDPRLAHLATNQKGEILMAQGSDEQTVVSDPYGGFLVPRGFANMLLSVPAEPDPIQGRTMMVPMDSPVVEIPARTDKNHSTSVTGGLTVNRKAETASATASRMEVEQVKLEAFDLWGFSYASEKLLSASPMSFATLLANSFAEEFRANHIHEVLNGTGVGEYAGILNAACTVEVAKESGQAADTIVYDNLTNMRSRCWGYTNAVWLYNHDCLPQLMGLTNSNNQYVWQTSAREGEPDRLFGRPAFATEFAQTLGDKGDIFCLNLTQYLEGEYRAMQTDESIHVRFDAGQRAFRFWKQTDGRPWWRSALTPKNSANTLSPFVVLAARA